MPSDENTNPDELQLEVIEEGESADGSQDTNGEGETEETGLDLKVEPEVAKLSPAEENAKRQEEAYLNRISNAEINPKTQKPYEVEDAPKWLQEKLLKRLDVVTKVPETEEVVRQVLEREREAQAFKALQAKIPPLSSAQAKELQERFGKLKSAGRVVALEAALDAMGLSEKVKEAEARGIAKGRMSLPKSGQPRVKNVDEMIGGVPASVVLDQKKWQKAVMTGGLE